MGFKEGVGRGSGFEFYGLKLVVKGVDGQSETVVLPEEASRVRDGGLSIIVAHSADKNSEILIFGY